MGNQKGRYKERKCGLCGGVESVTYISVDCKGIKGGMMKLFRKENDIWA